MMKQKQKSPKPVKPIHAALVCAWFVWLIYRLIGYPLIVHLATTADGLLGVFWQLLVLLPALLLTPFIKKGDSPYALIIASMVMLVYLATVGVFLLMRIYEQAPVLIWLGFGVETALLLSINLLLFVLLKRLPPMHKRQI